MKKASAILYSLLLFISTALFSSPTSDLHLTDQDVLQTHGLSVLLFHNPYHRVFGDQKMNGMEIILHDQRIATSGDLRLSPTPEQWDPIPDFIGRKRGSAPDELIASCTYPDRGLSYRIDVQPENGGFRIAVQLDQPVPAALAGKAGFNLEFLPTLYFGKSYFADDNAGIFPRHDDGPMQKETGADVEPVPLSSAHRVVLSPEDPLTRVSITSDSGPIMLFDGRNKAQNGWFVLRTLIPEGKTGDVVVWHVRPNLTPGWVRPPVIGYNQVGYTPEREKIAVLELDPIFDGPKTARILQLNPDGQYREVFQAASSRGEDGCVINTLSSIFRRFISPESTPLSTPGKELVPFESHPKSMTGVGAFHSIPIFRNRWITSKCGRAIASGTALLTSTTRGKLPSITHTSMATNRARPQIHLSPPVNTFPA